MDLCKRERNINNLISRREKISVSIRRREEKILAHTFGRRDKAKKSGGIRW